MPNIQFKHGFYKSSTSHFKFQIHLKRAIDKLHHQNTTEKRHMVWFIPHWQYLLHVISINLPFLDGTNFYDANDENWRKLPMICGGHWDCSKSHRRRCWHVKAYACNFEMVSLLLEFFLNWSVLLIEFWLLIPNIAPKMANAVVKGDQRAFEVPWLPWGI